MQTTRDKWGKRNPESNNFFYFETFFKLHITYSSTNWYSLYTLEHGKYNEIGKYEGICKERKVKVNDEKERYIFITITSVCQLSSIISLLILNSIQQSSYICHVNPLVYCLVQLCAKYHSNRQLICLLSFLQNPLIYLFNKGKTMDLNKKTYWVFGNNLCKVGVGKELVLKINKIINNHFQTYSKWPSFKHSLLFVILNLYFDDEHITLWLHSFYETYFMVQFLTLCRDKH